MEQPKQIRLMLAGEDRIFAGRLLSVLREAKPGTLVLVGTVAKLHEACELAGRVRPSVILMDVDTMGMEGVGLIRAQSQAPILVLATQRDAMLGARTLRAGGHGILMKTDSPETIRKALEKVNEGEIWLDRRTIAQVLRDAVGAPRKLDLASEEGIAILTSRERDIVIALVRYDGANGRALAARLGMSEQTLRNHFSSIYRKLGIPNRSGLVAYATRLRLDTAA